MSIVLPVPKLKYDPQQESVRNREIMLGLNRKVDKSVLDNAASGTFITADAKTVTVVDGIITSIV